MTVVDLDDRRPPATDWAVASAEDRKAAALEVAAAAAAAGKAMSGTELGEQFGRSERWGRNVLAELGGSRPMSPAAGSATARSMPAAGNPDTAGSPASGSRPGPAGNGTPSPAAGTRQPATGNRPGVAGSGSPAGTGTLPSPTAGGEPSRQPAAGAARQPRRQDTSRQPATSPAAGSSTPDLVILIGVGLIAAAASYGHQYNAARVVGEPQLIALLWPFTVDGLAFVAMRAGNRLWLRVGLAISVATNVIARAPELTAHGLTPLVLAGVAIAAWPPISAYGVHAVYERRRRAR